ncbi:MAG TPA: ABC transporter ATP-binding protein [Candidatus Limnocylindrales bacterium]|nr:ABC transporter ATP-binding protein [Candidatus Limnocylindrales bacterium]
MAGVTRRFDDTVAVENLDLEIPTGSVVGVVGPSGSGKTTTIRMITGSLGPTSGKVEVLGDNPGFFKRQTRERIGYMPQLFSLYPDLTVAENVDFAAAVYGLVFFRRWRRRRAVLELVDLWSVRRRRAGQLSGGMKRRLELAAALVHEPALLILDEPTAGIDPILRRTVWDEIHRLRDTGVTAIVTTQYVTEAEECDQVALISGGRLIAFGAPEQLRREALGGDVVEVTMSGLYDASTLVRPESVQGIRQTGPKTFELVVEDAGTATAEAVQSMSAAGGQVESVREIRPTFEDVFAHLVERDRAARAADPGDPAYEKNEGDRPPDPDAPGTPYASAPGASDEPPDEAVGPADDPAAPSDEAA